MKISIQKCNSDFEAKQNRLRALRSRQDLFQEEGVLNMILDTIDKFSQMEALPDFAGLIGEDTQVDHRLFCIKSVFSFISNRYSAISCLEKIVIILLHVSGELTV